MSHPSRPFALLESIMEGEELKRLRRSHRFILPPDLFKDNTAQVAADFGQQLILHEIYPMPYEDCLVLLPGVDPTVSTIFHFWTPPDTLPAAMFWRIGPTLDGFYVLEMDYGDHAQREETYKALILFLGLMNMPGVEERERKAPRLLQKRGKPRLLDYKTLVITPGQIRAPGYRAAGAKRASPRLHWRRGHLRHYGDRIKVIPPSLVGARALGFVSKEYRIT